MNLKYLKWYFPVQFSWTLCTDTDPGSSPGRGSDKKSKSDLSPDYGFVLASEM
jgi:hypothetical protein